MASVAASDLQKNFGAWHDKAYREPVEITRYGRTTAYLVSAALYHDMMASYRKAERVADLDEETMDLIRSSKVEIEQPYTLGDVSEAEGGPSTGR